MMRPYGQFDVPNNTKVEVEFPCPNCGEPVKEVYKIKPDPHADETAVCEKCSTGYHVIIMHGAGSGTVHVPAVGIDQKKVMAQGLP